MCSLHLGALEDQKHEIRRRQHYKELTKTIKNIKFFHHEGFNDWNNFIDNIHLSSQNNDVIYLGDLNLHNKGETGMIYENGMQDVHLDLNGAQDDGYTWDSKTNVLIGLILPCDNRRMRLDRIAVNQNSKNLRFNNCFIFADKKMKFSRMCRRYHASDHYGLASVFQFNADLVLEERFDYEANKKLCWKNVDPKKTGYREFKNIIRCRIAWLTFLGLMLIVGSSLAVVLLFKLVKFMMQ